jgi:hypothetical protein
VVADGRAAYLLSLAPDSSPNSDAGLYAEVSGQTLGLRLKPDTYERLMRDGIPFEEKIEPKPASGSIRVLVVDEDSGRIGSVTVPAASLP